MLNTQTRKLSKYPDEMKEKMKVLAPNPPRQVEIGPAPISSFISRFNSQITFPPKNEPSNICYVNLPLIAEHTKDISGIEICSQGVTSYERYGPVRDLMR